MLTLNKRLSFDGFRHKKSALILGIWLQSWCYSPLLKAHTSMGSQPVHVVSLWTAGQLLTNCWHWQSCKNTLIIPEWVSAGILQWGGKGSKMRGVDLSSASRGAGVSYGNYITAPVEGSFLHSTKLRQEGGPPQPPPPSIQKQEEPSDQRTEFDLLLERFGEQLQMVRDQDMFVVIETDLDSTWVQFPDEQQLLRPDVARELEQQRMQKLSRFILAFSDVLFLAYNTARSPKGTYDQPGKQFREIGVNETEPFPDGAGEGMRFLALDEGHPKWILPIPDVLIMELGARIEVREEVAGNGNITVAEAQVLNEIIKGLDRR